MKFFFLNKFLIFFFLFIAKSLVESQNKKASMMFLSKEASNKDTTLKTQMIVSLKDDKAESSSECVWVENDIFKDQRTDLTIVQANFPENTLVYVNQGSISSVKNGYAIYLDFAIIKLCLWPIRHLKSI